MPDEPAAVERPKHPVHALTTSELGDYRRRLEQAIRYYAKHHPAAPLLADLREALDGVLAEQDDRAKIAAANA